MPLNFDDLIPSDQSESPQAVAFDDLVPQQSQQQGGGFLDTIGKYLWQQTPEAKAVAEGVRKTIAGFVPTSISGAAQMATPVVGGVEDIVRGGKSLIDLSKGKSIDEITREHYPEAYRYENFKDKPLEEKAQLISGDIANALMAGGIAKGLIKAGTAEPSPLADRIGAINDELAKGFQPESVTFDDLIPKSETPSVAAEPEYSN